jgi:carboxypeptidase Taq
VLQDIHWSIGAFGYFATYTLGNVISRSCGRRIWARSPIATSRFAAATFAPLLDWLRENIHQHGRKYKAQEMVERVTGSRIDPQPYLEYLERKYRPIYGA